VLVFACSNGWAANYCADGNATACWLFKEGSGTTVDDSTSNNNVGTFKGINEPTWNNSVLPKPYTSWSVSFDGSNDGIEGVATSTHVNNTAFTVTLWFNADTFTTTSLNDRLVAIKTLDATSSAILHVYQSSSVNRIAIYNVNDASNSDLQTSLSTGTWYHYAISYDGSKYIGYLNGGAPTNVTKTMNAVGTAPIALGNNKGTSWGTTAFDGYSTEFATFTRVLNSTEINEIMDFGLSPTSTPTLGVSYIRGSTISGGSYIR